MILKNDIQIKIIDLLQNGEKTKADLANLCDVSITAITSHIQELKKLELILEEKSSLFTGGRIPTVIKLNKYKYFVGISLANSLIRINIIDIFKKPIDELIFSDGYKSFNEYLLKAKNLVISLLEKNNIDNSNVVSYGLSLPGPVNNIKEYIEFVNFGFQNIDFKNIKNNLFENIYIENEANLALLYEIYIRDINKTSSTVYISVNQGFGAGIYQNNDFLKSNLGYAGEIGNIIIDYKNKVYAEDIVSIDKILNKYNSNNDKINSIEELFDLINTDKNARDIIDEVINVINTTIHNVDMVLDPSNIIVGGKLTRLIMKQNLINSEFKNSETTKIIYSDNHNSTTKGAALYSLYKTLGKL